MDTVNPDDIQLDGVNGGQESHRDQSALRRRNNNRKLNSKVRDGPEAQEDEDEGDNDVDVRRLKEKFDETQ
jgi:hypothetical protein